MKAGLVVAVIGVLALSWPTTAQTPSRDAQVARTSQRGTAQVSVRVVTDDSSTRPLRRVSVAIQAGELDVPNIGVTDDEGRVAFSNLAAGNYMLTAMRQGYVRTYYGSALPGRGPGTSVAVLEGQKVAEVTIRMLRGSVITGTVRTASGKPAPNQAVQATLVRTSGGERRAVLLEGALGSTMTDDRGVYRIFGLAPGEYIVLVPGSSIAAEEMRPMTTAELQWADGLSASGAANAATSAPGAAPHVAYAPVYFPGTAVAAEATVLTIGPGEERAGVDFAMRLVPTARITGRVLDASGQPQGSVSVSLRPTRPDGLDLFASLFSSTGFTGTDGTFTLNGVKPGSYTLSVRATPRAAGEAAPDQRAQTQQAVAALLGGGGSGQTHFASQELAIQGQDVSDVILQLRPGMIVTGRIVYEATTKTPPADLSKSPASVALVSATTTGSLGDMIGSLVGGGTTAPTVAADGTFTIRGIAPGRYRLTTPLAMIPMAGMNMMGGGWTLKSVTAGGRDIADAPIDIRAGIDVSDVVVTFTDRPTELSGTVIDGAGRATADFPIVVFSTDRAYWTLGSRRVQTARPATDGKYSVTGLPAGEYFVCAVTAVDRTEVYEQEFLERLAQASFKITIADGEKKTQDLKLGGR